MFVLHNLLFVSLVIFDSGAASINSPSSRCRPIASTRSSCHSAVEPRWNVVSNLRQSGCATSHGGCKGRPEMLRNALYCGEVEWLWVMPNGLMAAFPGWPRDAEKHTKLALLLWWVLGDRREKLHVASYSQTCLCTCTVLNMQHTSQRPNERNWCVTESRSSQSKKWPRMLCS